MAVNQLQQASQSDDIIVMCLLAAFFVVLRDFSKNLVCLSVMNLVTSLEVDLVIKFWQLVASKRIETHFGGLKVKSKSARIIDCKTDL